MNKRKRQVLLDAQQLFQENGFNLTSVQDILNKSQISKGTFYNYFSSKNECLMAILDEAQNDASVRRQELLINHDVSDKKILAKQIAVRFQVSREYNLFPLFEASYHSGDRELRAYVKQNHLTEVYWLSNRIVEVYGIEARPYAPDCAVMLLGFMHQLFRLRFNSSNEIGTSQLIDFTMRRLDSIILNMIDTKDFLLGESIFTRLNKPTITSKQLLGKFDEFIELLSYEEYEKSKQYVEFLMTEIKSNCPRILLLESVIKSFKEAFIESSYEAEALSLITNIWKYIDAKKNSSNS